MERDPAALLVEDFEREPRRVESMQTGGWFDAQLGPGEGMERTDALPAAAGKHCLQFNLKKGAHSSGYMFQRVPPSACLYYRYYRRFEKDWQWPEGYIPHDVAIYGGNFVRPTHNDLSIDVGPTPTGATVVRLASVGQKRSRDEWDDWLRKNQATSPVGGLPWNRSEPETMEPLKWHCVEVMAALSTPGGRDGTIKLWVNGKLVTACDELPLRDADHPDLRLHLVLLGPHFYTPSPRDQRHWADQLVVATRPIGPVRPL